MRSPYPLAPCFALALLLSAPVAAQGYKVLPLIYTVSEGPSSSAYPFGYTHTRTQQIWNGSAVTNSVAIINGFQYRRDTNDKSPMVARTYTNATISMGTTTVTTTSMSQTFSANITSPLTKVLSAGTLSLPAQPAPTQSPAAFNIGLNWNTPYLFDKSRGHLMLQIELPGTPGKSNYFVDAAEAPGSNTGSALPFGTGGSFSTPEIYRMSGNAAALRPGGAVEIGCGGFARSYIGSLVLGVSNATWSGARLPLDLAFLGAPKNNLYVSMDLQVPFNTTLNGRNYESSFKTPIPNSGAFAGLNFFAQAWYLDQPANPAGLVTTEALSLTTAGGSAAAVTNLIGHYDTTSATGNFWYGATKAGGPIVQFYGVFP